MLTVSFIRHGESADNVRAVWSGWSDPSLTNHGMNQAKACGQYFSDVKLSAVYTSDLKRANMTAQAVYEAQAEPKPSLYVSADLREQNFGVAEGQPWVVSSPEGISVEKKIFPIPVGREGKFPDGECLNDVAERATRVVKELILPWILDPEKSVDKSEGNIHIVVVSHGLFISEVIAALTKADSDGYGQDREYRGLFNTAWSRVTIAVKDELQQATSPALNPGETAPLVVRVTHINQKEHLQGIVRQTGGIGSAAYDPSQKDIREFFGGKTA